jgi:hypothetical protein
MLTSNTPPLQIPSKFTIFGLVPGFNFHKSKAIK